MLPEASMDEIWREESLDGARILRLRAPKTKNIGQVRRTLAEVAMPFAMLRALKRSPFSDMKWDGVIWYSPSIFHGPLVKELKRTSECKGYLIIRDIFPQWALDMGLIKHGLLYRFFDAIARYQYSVADIIGVQSPGNLCYFDKWTASSGGTLEVLPNWLGDPGGKRSSIRIDETALAGRDILVYAGNMGIAQNMDIIIQLAERMRDRRDIGFLFVGRGSEVGHLKRSAASLNLDNVLFFDEIDPDEIPDLYSQCSLGIVSLDPRHKSHNIPGKFLTYMQSGLPVIANVNVGNDLAAVVRDREVGAASEANNVAELAEQVSALLSNGRKYTRREKCLELFREQFSVELAARRVVAHFATRHQLP